MARAGQAFEIRTEPHGKGAAGEGRDFVIVLAGDDQSRAVRPFDDDAGLRLGDGLAGFVTPTTERVQCGGIIGIRHGASRAMQRAPAAPGHDRRRRDVRQAPDHSGRRQCVDQDQCGGPCLDRSRQREQPAEAGADQCKRRAVMPGFPAPVGDLGAVIGETRRREPLRAGLKVTADHVDATRAQHARPDVPFPGTTASAMHAHNPPGTLLRRLAHPRRSSNPIRHYHPACAVQLDPSAAWRKACRDARWHWPSPIAAVARSHCPACRLERHPPRTMCRRPPRLAGHPSNAAATCCACEHALPSAAPHGRPSLHGSESRAR